MSRARGPVETTEFGKMVERMLRAYGRRVADADEVDLAQLVRMQAVLSEAMQQAVDGMRDRGESWTYIARGAGISRQAAHMKWSKRGGPQPELGATSNQPSLQEG